MLDSKTAWWMSKGLHCLSGQMGWGTWSWVWSLVKGFGPATLSGVQPSSPGWGGEGLRAPGREAASAAWQMDSRENWCAVLLVKASSIPWPDCVEKLFC